MGSLRSPRGDVVFARRPELFPVHEDGPSFAMAVLGFFAHAAGRPVKATRILLAERPLVPPHALEAELGAPIAWNAGDLEIHFPPGTLDLPVVHADPILKESLERAARRELSRTGASKTPPATSLVREALRESGFGPNLTKTSMAKALGMSARTITARDTWTVTTLDGRGGLVSGANGRPSNRCRSCEPHGPFALWPSPRHDTQPEARKPRMGTASALPP